MTRNLGEDPRKQDRRNLDLTQSLTTRVQVNIFLLLALLTSSHASST